MSEPLAELIVRHGLDTVAGAFACGGTDLDKPNLGVRRRTRLELTDDAGGVHVLFLKRYGSPTLGQMLAGLWPHGRWCSTAMIERDNILAARAAGVSTMDVLAAGEEKASCCGLRSYLVVTAVTGEALERCDAAFWAKVSDGPAAAQFIGELASLVGRLHAAGYVHRDLYAAHVFAESGPGGVRLHLIDLARMFRPRWRAFRWRVKDLAQLRYSLPAAWVAQYWDAFLQQYLAACGDGAGAGPWNRAIVAKVARMQHRAARKAR